jgi:hypothetical protein
MSGRAVRVLFVILGLGAVLGLVLLGWSEYTTAEAEQTELNAFDECEYAPPAGSDVCGPAEEDGFCFQTYCLDFQAEETYQNATAFSGQLWGWGATLTAAFAGGAVLLLMFRRMDRIEAPLAGSG